MGADYDWMARRSICTLLLAAVSDMTTVHDVVEQLVVQQRAMLLCPVEFAEAPCWTNTIGDAVNLPLGKGTVTVMLW